MLEIWISYEVIKNVTVLDMWQDQIYYRIQLYWDNCISCKSMRGEGGRSRMCTTCEASLSRVKHVSGLVSCGVAVRCQWTLSVSVWTAEKHQVLSQTREIMSRNSHKPDGSLWRWKLLKTAKTHQQQHQGKLKMAEVHAVLISDQLVMIEQIINETGIHTVQSIPQ